MSDLIKVIETLFKTTRPQQSQRVARARWRSRREQEVRKSVRVRRENGS